VRLGQIHMMSARYEDCVAALRRAQVCSYVCMYACMYVVYPLYTRVMCAQYEDCVAACTDIVHMYACMCVCVYVCSTRAIHTHDVRSL
jgi:hypothetical protein